MYVWKLEVKRVTEKEYRRDIRTIYDTLWENPRGPDSTISTILGAKIAAVRTRMAYEAGYIVGPEIRKRSYKNLKEYMYFINCKNPELLYIKLRDDPKVVYHAKTSGCYNMWIVAKERMDIKGEIVLEGYRSDYCIPYAPDHSWKTTLGIMRKKADNFNPDTYQHQDTIRIHLDDIINWNEEREIFYRYFKYNLRKPFTPLARKGLSKKKADEFFNNLQTTCTIHTSYYPDSLSAYTHYLFMIETDYEDFIINLFSELPSSVSFFKVSKRLFASTYVPQQVVRNQDLKVTPKRSCIPLLLIDLLEKGIIKFKDYSIVEYAWAKSL